MHLPTWSAASPTLLAISCAALVALASSARAQTDEMRALDGDWIYVEDVTEGRADEDRQPAMGSGIGFRAEADAIVMMRGIGPNRREERCALDGSVRETKGEGTTKSYSGTWKDGAFEFLTVVVRDSDKKRITHLVKSFRPTPDGLLVRVIAGDPVIRDSLALYRHPQDIPLPTPAEAGIDDLAWLAGAWVGTRYSSSIEERWSPPLGGSMLGTSRTVSRGSLRAFEYLRIVERDGGLVYVAQPGGSPPTEFVLTDLGSSYAVFDNPRHDSPQRIVYELFDDALTASTGMIHTGRPSLYEYVREEVK